MSQLGRPLESKDGKGNPPVKARVPQEIRDWVLTQPKGWLHDLVVAEYEKAMKNAQDHPHTPDDPA